MFLETELLDIEYDGRVKTKRERWMEVRREGGRERKREKML